MSGLVPLPVGAPLAGSALVPACDAQFTSPSSFAAATSCVRLLHPVADQLRDIAVQLGMRAYRVRIVRTRWTAGFRGRGAEIVVLEREILPVPEIYDVGSLQRVLTPVGLDEAGGVTLREVSSRFTEEFLSGYDDDGTPCPKDENVYYEIEFIRPDGAGRSQKRRFTLSSAPELDLTKTLGWLVKLERSHPNRARDGQTGGDFKDAS
ncbi:MAG: hypothetical protein WC700_09025 [Gemmatimonadaceae bacterium]